MDKLRKYVLFRPEKKRCKTAKNYFFVMCQLIFVTVLEFFACEIFLYTTCRNISNEATFQGNQILKAPDGFIAFKKSIFTKSLKWP